MTNSTTEATAWLEPVRAALSRSGPPAPLLVVFEAYRPDLVRAMAHHLGFRFVDFRAEHMLPLGAEGARLPLSRLSDVMHRALAADDGPAASGLVLHNVEALLATRPAAERIGWLADFVARDSAAPVIVPLAVFADDAPSGHGNVVRIDAGALPPEKLLFRMAAQ